MTRPYIAPHRIAGTTRDWSAIGAYVQPPLDYPDDTYRDYRFSHFVSDTYGERLVSFFREHGERLSFIFAMCSIALLIASVVAAYVGGVR